jgi:predicted nucleic acid-binding protein
LTGPIVPDTSAWIEFLRHTGSPLDERIFELLAEPHRLIVTGPVLLELVSGAAPGEPKRVRNLLARCGYAHVLDPHDFRDAAALYRNCRARGVNLRGHLDCLTAAIAMRIEAAVLSADADFARIAEHAPLEIA